MVKRDLMLNPLKIKLTPKQKFYLEHCLKGLIGGLVFAGLMLLFAPQISLFVILALAVAGTVIGFSRARVEYEIKKELYHLKRRIYVAQKEIAKKKDNAKETLEAVNALASLSRAPAIIVNNYNDGSAAERGASESSPLVLPKPVEQTLSGRAPCS